MKGVVAFIVQYVMLNEFCGPRTDYKVLPGVTEHRINTLDNQCGATITDSSTSGASLPLCKRTEEGKTTKNSLVVGKSKTVLNVIKS